MAQTAPSAWLRYCHLSLPSIIFCDKSLGGGSFWVGPVGSRFGGGVGTWHTLASLWSSEERTPWSSCGPSSALLPLRPGREGPSSGSSGQFSGGTASPGRCWEQTHPESVKENQCPICPRTQTARHRHERFTTLHHTALFGRKLEARGGKIHFPVTEPDGPHPHPAQPRSCLSAWGGVFPHPPLSLEHEG